MTSSPISVTVEESHQPRIRKYHQNNDLFTSKNENPTVRSGQLDTKEVSRSEDECDGKNNYLQLVLDIFSDGLSDIEAFNHHSSDGTDSNDKSDGEPGLVPRADLIKIWNKELQIIPQRNNEQSEENPSVHYSIDEFQQPKTLEYAKDDNAAIGQTRDPPQIFREWYKSIFDHQSGGLFLSHPFVPDDVSLATIHTPDLDDFKVDCLLRDERDTASNISAETSPAVLATKYSDRTYLRNKVNINYPENRGGTIPDLFQTMANTSIGESAQINTKIRVISHTACEPINQLFSDSEFTESQVSGHSVISSSFTTSEHGMSQDYTFSFEAKNPILIGSERSGSSFRTSQAAFMAKRARIKWRQTIVKPKLQFKLCNAVAHKIQVPYYVRELTNNSFLQEQHTEFSNNENKQLKNDAVSYGLTNNTMGHTTGNSLKRVSHNTQEFVKKWLDRKDEIKTDCEPPKRLADGRILSIKRERVDSISKQITKYSRVQEETPPDLDSIILLSNYSCEYDRACLFERF